IGDESAGGTHGHVAGVVGPTFENRVNQGGAARIGEELAAETDQSARRNAELHAHAAGMMVDHFFHFAAAAAEKFHNDADEIFRAVNDEELERLDTAAVFCSDDDFRFADHHFVAFAAHRFNQNGELQFAASEN